MSTQTALQAEGALRFESLRLERGDARLGPPLDGAIRPGLITALTGPNGSGKSTFVRVLLGLEAPAEGRVFMRSGERASYVPQSTSLGTGLPLTAREVVAMGARCSADRTRRCVDAELEALGLHEVADRRFSALSGGERQRVLVARALIGRPSLLVLDEPTAGVDATATQRVDQALHQVASDPRIIVLLVTHDRLLHRAHDRFVLDASGLHRLDPA